jgi:hypothetical protein
MAEPACETRETFVERLTFRVDDVVWGDRPGLGELVVGLLCGRRDERPIRYLHARDQDVFAVLRAEHSDGCAGVL